jgi:predicted lipoprotein with Yx(FWY)xxD motif
MNSGDPSGPPVRRTVVQANLRRRSPYLAVLVGAVLLLAACGNDDTKAKAGSATTAGGGATTTTTEAPTTGAAAAPVSTTSNPTLGQILVDAKGLTVYVFDQDKDGTIACVAGCANAWPPVVLEAGAAIPTTGALAADLSAVARPDGAQQVAYKSRPLYRFAGDAKPGDIKGDGVGNIWHAVKVGTTGSAPATTTPRVSPY